MPAAGKVWSNVNVAGLAAPLENVPSAVQFVPETALWVPLAKFQRTVCPALIVTVAGSNLLLVAVTTASGVTPLAPESPAAGVAGVLLAQLREAPTSMQPSAKKIGSRFMARTLTQFR